MHKKIMVPIAFSEYAQGIIDHAASIAKPLGAKMMIVNVINERDLEAVERIASYGYKVDRNEYLNTVKEERRTKLKELTKNLTLPEEDLSFSFRVGTPIDELLKYVVEKEIDLVIMGVKNRDITHFFTGSVATQMFTRCPCTIVSYRDEGTTKRLTARINKHR